MQRLHFKSSRRESKSRFHSSRCRSGRCLGSRTRQVERVLSWRSRKIGPVNRYTEGSFWFTDVPRRERSNQPNVDADVTLPDRSGSRLDVVAFTTSSVVKPMATVSARSFALELRSFSH